MKSDESADDVSVDYDPETNTYRAEFHAPETDASRAVVETIAQIRGEEPTAFEPLYESTVPDALDRLCSSHATDDSTGHCVIEFSHLDCEITVESAGIVEIGPRSRAQSEERVDE